MSKTLNYVLVAVAASTAACIQSDADQSDNIANRLPPVSEATWANVGTLECRPATTDACGPSGCQRQSQSYEGWSRWTPAANRYERCDRNGCSAYTATVNYSGAFANLELSGHATIARLTGRNDYTEVVTFLDTVMIHRGQCHPVR